MIIDGRYYGIAEEEGIVEEEATEDVCEVVENLSQIPIPER